MAQAYSLSCAHGVAVELHPSDWSDPCEKAVLEFVRSCIRLKEFETWLKQMEVDHDPSFEVCAASFVAVASAAYAAAGALLFGWTLVDDVDDPSTSRDGSPFQEARQLETALRSQSRDWWPPAEPAEYAAPLLHPIFFVCFTIPFPDHRRLSGRWMRI
jgi:hypothetical protein